MSFAFSFGSFGDILALIELAAKVAHILTSTSGASESYQALILDVTRLQHFLQQLNSFSRHRNVTILKSQLLSPEDVASAIKECTRSLERILQRVTYYRSFVESRCGSSVHNSWRRTWMTSGWMLLKSREIAEFRAELLQHNTLLARILSAMSCESIQVVQNVAMETSSHVGDVLSNTTMINSNLNVALQILHNLDQNISATIVRNWTADGASPVRVQDYFGKMSVLPRQTCFTPEELCQFIIHCNNTSPENTGGCHALGSAISGCWGHCDECGHVSHDWFMLQDYLTYHPNAPLLLEIYFRASECRHEGPLLAKPPSELGWRLSSTDSHSLGFLRDYRGPVVELGFYGD
ncbi:unnamed protein product [Somion occarium]|uniref:Fungal N-terminal domain-containing protein n=1 Tax=Somion occarium TaxID=3059160 RepID=A0ABP1EAG0_9APHY